MNGIEIIHLLILSIAIGFGFFFLFGPHYNPFQSRLFGFFFLLSNFRFLNFLLLKYHLSSFAPYFYPLSGVLMFFIPPVFWLYLESIIDKKNRFEKSDWLHFAPGIMLCILILPRLIQPEAVMIEQMETLGQMEVAKVFFVYLSDQEPNMRFAFSMGIYFSIYLFFFWKKLIPFISTKTKKVIDPSTRFFLIWLFSGFTFTLLFSFVLSLINHGWIGWISLSAGIELVYGLRSIMYLVLVILLLKNRELMFGVVTIDTDELQMEEKMIELTEEEERQNWFLIDHYLAGHPYVQQQFNLQVMSKSIQLSSSIVSGMIRQKYEKSFVEFRNDLRVEYAKTLMEQHLHKTQTLESIGRMSGFASRTTFFNSFKKSTGMNPSQFIEEMGG